MKDAFESFLKRLDPDLEMAGVRYKELRERLVSVVVWHGGCYPEDQADEVLSRAIRKLGQGAQTSNVFAYAVGIAKNVVREQWRDPEHNVATIDSLSPSQHPTISPFEIEEEEEARAEREALYLECLQTCLGRFSDDNKNVLLAYYTGDKRARITRRKELASRLRLAQNALRIRAYRLRQKAESCVLKCVRAKKNVIDTDSRH